MGPLCSLGGMCPLTCAASLGGEHASIVQLVWRPLCS